MGLEDNKTIVKRFLVASGCGDLETVAALLTDDAQVVTMGSSMVSGNRNREQVLELLKSLSTLLRSGIEFTFLTITAEEDRVSCEMMGRSTLVKGGEYNNQYHMLAKLRDGKLRSLREYIDTKYTDAVLGPVIESRSAEK